METANQHKRSRLLIQSYEAKALKKRDFTVRIADSLTSFFGTLVFLFINILVFSGWIVINLGYIPGIAVFDPFPFVLMTTAVSLEAIILSVIVLMSQNRSSVISSMREELQLQVALYAEREVTHVLRLVKMLLDREKIKIDDPEINEMLKDFDASYIERKLEQQIAPKQENFVQNLTKPLEELNQTIENTLSPKHRKN